MDEKALAQMTLTLDDIVSVVSKIIELNHNPNAINDDIDHLGSRRVRFVGELLQQKIRVGMTQIKRNIQNRMSTIDTDATLPVQFVSPRPLQARIKEFFTTNQLSQFMSQENILAEIEHLLICIQIALANSSVCLAWYFRNSHISNTNRWYNRTPCRLLAILEVVIRHQCTTVPM